MIRAERILLERHDRPAPERPNRVAGEIVHESAYGSSHTLFFRPERNGQARPHDLQLDIPAHPYEFLGVSQRRRWFVSIPLTRSTYSSSSRCLGLLLPGGNDQAAARNTGI